MKRNRRQGRKKRSQLQRRQEENARLKREALLINPVTTSEPQEREPMTDRKARTATPTEELNRPRTKGSGSIREHNSLSASERFELNLLISKLDEHFDKTEDLRRHCQERCGFTVTLGNIKSAFKATGRDPRELVRRAHRGPAKVRLLKERVELLEARVIELETRLGPLLKEGGYGLPSH